MRHFFASLEVRNAGVRNGRTHGLLRPPSAKLRRAVGSEGGGSSTAHGCRLQMLSVRIDLTREKNTLEMNKVKRKIPGRPRRSQSALDLQALGRRIRQLRGAATQEEFSRALGISQAQLSKYELGQSALPLGVLAKLAGKSGRSTDWILMGNG